MTFHLKKLGMVAVLATTLTTSACGNLNSGASSAVDIGDAKTALTQFPNDAVTKKSGMGPVIGAIDNANKSVSMEIYSLNDIPLEDSLIQTHRRGKQVHVMLNSAFGGNKFNQNAYARLKSAGVDVKWAPSGYIFHIKTLVVDDTALISTANFNVNDYSTYRDAIITDKNPAHVKAIQQTFDADFTLKGTPADHAAKGR